MYNAGCSGFSEAVLGRKQKRSALLVLLSALPRRYFPPALEIKTAPPLPPLQKAAAALEQRQRSGNDTHYSR